MSMSHPPTANTMALRPNPFLQSHYGHNYKTKKGDIKGVGCGLCTTLLKQTANNLIVFLMLWSCTDLCHIKFALSIQNSNHFNGNEPSLTICMLKPFDLAKPKQQLRRKKQKHTYKGWANEWDFLYTPEVKKKAVNKKAV